MMHKKECISKEEIKTLDKEGFLIKTAPDGTVLICGKTSRGTLYGVYRFFELFVGFCAVTKDVERVDEKKDLYVPETNLAENPDFEYRDANFRGAFDGGFAERKATGRNTQI